MIKLYKHMIGLGGLLIGFVLTFLRGKKAGVRKQAEKQRKVVEKNVKKAKQARDNLTTTERNRVRKKYSRR